VLEHEQGEQVVPARLPRAQAAGEEAEGARQPGLVLVGQLAQVGRGAHHQQIDGPQAVPRALRHRLDQVIDALRDQGVGIQGIQEDGR
jgi:hypothetical protein